MEGRRICREMSPERGAKAAAKVMKPTFKKVQVVYYLSANGLLQHPHYIEVSHLSHQQLRLKDVLDRLTVLRGKGMPFLYSWSCKRSYKNGYVWNDLAQSDFIFPSEGGEYVLKGSQILEDCTEKVHHLQIGNVQHNFQHGGPESNFYRKRRSSASKQQIEDQEMMNDHHLGEEEDEEYEEKTTHATCSRGVSTDEIEGELKQKSANAMKNNPSHTELNLDANSLSSPPSTASSTLSDNPNNELAASGNGSKRFEDGDPIGNEPMLSRNSMLFSLIACGGSGSFRKTVLPSPPPPSTAARKSCSGSSLHKGVVCKAAAAAKMAAAAEEEDRVMINYMSENPRFGSLLAEEKEYFSGSIVESMANDHERAGAGGPVLKKSSSYNQERCGKAGLGEEAKEEVKKEKGGMKGKCIPRKKKPKK